MLDPLSLDRLTCRTREAYVGSIHISGTGIRGNEPEHRVGALESFVDDFEITVGSLNDHYAFPRLFWNAGFASNDDADRFAAIEKLF
jgi:hypothetical protein